VARLAWHSNLYRYALAEVPTPPLAPRRAVNHLATTTPGKTTGTGWPTGTTRRHGVPRGRKRLCRRHDGPHRPPPGPLVRTNPFPRSRDRHSSPIFHGGWWYWSRTLAGQQYPVHCRRPTPTGPCRPAESWPPPGPPWWGGRRRRRHTGPRTGQTPDVEVAPHAGRSSSTRTDWRQFGYLAIGVFDVRPDHQVLAYAVDDDGSERYTLRFRDLGSGTTWRTSSKTSTTVRLGRAGAQAFITCVPTRPCGRGRCGVMSWARRRPGTSWSTRRTTSASTSRSN